MIASRSSSSGEACRSTTRTRGAQVPPGQLRRLHNLTSIPLFDCLNSPHVSLQRQRGEFAVRRANSFHPHSVRRVETQSSREVPYQRFIRMALERALHEAIR
jgi:hypothetical protein